MPLIYWPIVFYTRDTCRLSKQYACAALHSLSAEIYISFLFQENSGQHIADAKIYCTIAVLEYKLSSAKLAVHCFVFRMESNRHKGAHTENGLHIHMDKNWTELIESWWFRLIWSCRAHKNVLSYRFTRFLGNCKIKVQRPKWNENWLQIITNGFPTKKKKRKCTLFWSSNDKSSPSFMSLLSLALCCVKWLV